MLASKLLPKFFREVLPHVPTLAMKSMDWKGLIKELGPMTARLGKRRLEEDCFQSLRGLEIRNINLVQSTLENNFETLTKEHKKDTGEAVLRLYFGQLKNPKGLALDLRPKHFRREDGKVCFAPNNVWFHFREDFRLALVDLYKGFYHDKDELFDSALVRVGLTKGLGHQESERLKELFRTHFGPGEQDVVKFELEHFQESFYQLFSFFMDHEVSLDKDFMFLGVYLVGLYMNLQELGEPVNVKAAFMEVFPEV